MTIRLLDPPLHEFLPEGDLEEIVKGLTAETGMSEDEVFSRIEKLSEVNPMLGFRGCRYDITMPLPLPTFFKWFLIVSEHVGSGSRTRSSRKCKLVQSFRLLSQ